MSRRRRLLNALLRLTEKRHLARAVDPVPLRRSFERRARLFFRPPRGAVFRDDRLGGVPVLWARARGMPEQTGPLILHFHGGGYVFGSSRTHRAMLAHLSALTGLRACLPDYRLAPEHAFPAAFEDALAVYRAVAARPGGVILGGDSAGGGLALAVLARAMQEGWTRPVALYALSPLTDLTFSGASVGENARAEALLPVERLEDATEMYLQGADRRDPRASPLFADLRGAPPVWLVAGDTEILRDDTRRMAEKLRAEGVPVTVRIEHDLPHVWPIFQGWLPEARATLEVLAGWIRSLSSNSGES